MKKTAVGGKVHWNGRGQNTSILPDLILFLHLILCMMSIAFSSISCLKRSICEKDIHTKKAHSSTHYLIYFIQIILFQIKDSCIAASTGANQISLEQGWPTMRSPEAAISGQRLDNGHLLPYSTYTYFQDKLPLVMWYFMEVCQWILAREQELWGLLPQCLPEHGQLKTSWDLRQCAKCSYGTNCDEMSHVSRCGLVVDCRASEESWAGKDQDNFWMGDCKLISCYESLEPEGVSVYSLADLLEA